MSTRRPEPPPTDRFDNSVESRMTPCPPIGRGLAALSWIAIRITLDEIEQATRRTTMPKINATETSWERYWGAFKAPESDPQQTVAAGFAWGAMVIAASAGIVATGMLGVAKWLGGGQ